MVMEAALAPLEDDALTLQEALAFIDACEGDAPISPTPPPPRCPSRSDATASASAESDDGLAQLRDERRRRKTLNALAVRRCQRRKKQELQELRVQAAALERRLAGLRAAGARGLGTSGHDQQSLWAFMAEREAAERESSEARNRQLRAALNRYFRLAGALQSLVGADAVDPVRRRRQVVSKLLVLIVRGAQTARSCRRCCRRALARCMRPRRGSSRWTTRWRTWSCR